MKKLFCLILASFFAFGCAKVTPDMLKGKAFGGSYKDWQITMKFDTGKEGKLCSQKKGGKELCTAFTYETKGDSIRFTLGQFMLKKTVTWADDKITGSGFQFHVDSSMENNVTLSAK